MALILSYAYGNILVGASLDFIFYSQWDVFLDIVVDLFWKVYLFAVNYFCLVILQRICGNWIISLKF